MQVTAKSSEHGMKKQRGGTLLGLVIGALLGLGIALTVAVYVTKVPVPFMNKSPTHRPDSDAAEALKNKDWNPNAPLAGKNPARPAAPSAAGDLIPPVEPEAEAASTVPDPVLTPERGAAPEAAAKPKRVAAPEAVKKPERAAAPEAVTKPERVVKTPKPATPVEASVAAPAVPAPAVVAKPARPPSADPLGDLVKAKSRSEAAPAAASGSDPFNYFIQAGAYRTPEDAEQQRARLLLLGMQAKVTEREQAGRTVYRVRVGPFDKKDDADKIKDKLDNSSIETALVRVQR
ncbi:Sporulation domain protein [Polaromonas naphthalenivorans CJ2]|uniref:Sporulation domain protein n=2 Tax=Polaromonas naphthalenivorans TaxID=216465 RepID=A1VTM0_POLNA|nr:Sporulation domain protein [Polaromonas naphthalenivorans CJ2]